MRARPAGALAVALLALSSLAGCGGGGGGRAAEDGPTPGFSTTTQAPSTTIAAGSVVSIDNLDGKTFRSTSIHGYDLVPGTAIALSFSGSGLTATLGCVTMSGPFSVVDEHLAWLVLPTETQPPSPCSGYAKLQDAWLRTALIAGFDGTLDDDGNLHLKSDDVKVVLAPQEEQVAPPGLFGTWTLETVVRDDDAGGPDPTTAAPQLRLDGSGTLLVSTGCNQGSGRFELGFGLGATAGFVQFEGLALTKQACDGAAGDVEDAIVDVLGGQAVMSLSEDHLSIARGTTSLLFRST